MSTSLFRCGSRWLGACCLLAAFAAPSSAQVLGGLPGAGLPQPGLIVDRIAQAPRALESRVADPLVRRLLRRHPDLVVLDPHGAAILRNELVAVDPRDDALELARMAGFEIGPRRNLDALGFRLVVLRAPAGIATDAALLRMRQLDPKGIYDFNHLYFGSGAAAGVSSNAGAGTPAAATPRLRIGLIDSGVAGTHPALRGTELHAWGCDGKPVPAEHGTAVASLLRAGTLYGADIYCGQATGGSATAFAAAMAWMAREQVPVINISLVGPDNALLRRATEAMLARGHVLVAAVGNDGPAAAPLYPAAYPGVIGVTGVDARERALPEALRGPQVDFAAHGSGLRAAAIGGDWDKVRGTSFAAPMVARAAAELVDAPHPGNAARVSGRLAEGAVDLGDGGRDDTYGDGLIE